jgi:hypothetical protein
MAIGSNGPPNASADDIEGWGAEQVCFFLVRPLGQGTFASDAVMLHAVHVSGVLYALVTCTYSQLCTGSEFALHAQNTYIMLAGQAAGVSGDAADAPKDHTRYGSGVLL